MLVFTGTQVLVHLMYLPSPTSPTVCVCGSCPHCGRAGRLKKGSVSAAVTPGSPKSPPAGPPNPPAINFVPVLWRLWTITRTPMMSQKKKLTHTAVWGGSTHESHPHSWLNDSLKQLPLYTEALWGTNDSLKVFQGICFPQVWGKCSNH